MAQPTNTFDSYDATGIREDLSNVIHNISPTDTPFLTRAAKESCDNTYFEWQVDSLASASGSNFAIEGDDASGDSLSATTRKGNRTNISRKVVVTSGTGDAVDTAGRKSETAYYLAKAGKELKRDMETILTQNNAAVTGNASTARETGGALAWLETNTARGTGGSDGGSGTTAATNGTQRALTETLMKGVIKDCWTEGGSPDTVMVGSHVKTVISGFSGTSTQYTQTPGSGQGTIHAASDVYVSDFGTFEIVPNRFSSARDAYVIDWDYWAVSYLRPFKQEKLAKTGDSSKTMLLAEYGLKSKNEAASGVVADLSTS